MRSNTALKFSGVEANVSVAAKGYYSDFNVDGTIIKQFTPITFFSDPNCTIVIPDTILVSVGETIFERIKGWVGLIDGSIYYLITNETQPTLTYAT